MLTFRVTRVNIIIILYIFGFLISDLVYRQDIYDVSILNCYPAHFFEHLKTVFFKKSFKDDTALFL